MPDSGGAEEREAEEMQREESEKHQEAKVDPVRDLSQAKQVDPEKIPLAEIAGGYDQLRQLLYGPVWDGNLMSKDAQRALLAQGFADRREGWTFITPAGYHALCEEAIRMVPILQKRLWGLQESLRESLKQSIPVE